MDELSDQWAGVDFTQRSLSLLSGAHKMNEAEDEMIGDS